MKTASIWFWPDTIKESKLASIDRIRLEGVKSCSVITTEPEPVLSVVHENGVFNVKYSAVMVYATYDDHKSADKAEAVKKVTGGKAKG